MAFSEVQFLQDGCVRVFGVLQDDRIISFNLPDPETALVGFSLPALDAAEVASHPSGGEQYSSPSSARRDEVLEQSLLETLGGNPYHIKAWMPEEQEYLLYNVNGFVVSYLALSGPETQLLFNIARREGKEVPTEQAINDNSKLTDSEKRAIVAENRDATFERISQARKRLEQARKHRGLRALGATGKLRKSRTGNAAGPRLWRIVSSDFLPNGKTGKYEVNPKSSILSRGEVPSLGRSSDTSTPRDCSPRVTTHSDSPSNGSNVASVGTDSPSNGSTKSRKNSISVMAPGNTDIIGLEHEAVSAGLECLQKELQKIGTSAVAVAAEDLLKFQKQSRRLAAWGSTGQHEGWVGSMLSHAADHGSPETRVPTGQHEDPPMERPQLFEEQPFSVKVTTSFEGYL